MALVAASVGSCQQPGHELKMAGDKSVQHGITLGNVMSRRRWKRVVLPKIVASVIFITGMP